MVMAVVEVNTTPVFFFFFTLTPGGSVRWKGMRGSQLMDAWSPFL